jgi:hypothetical protein
MSSAGAADSTFFQPSAPASVCVWISPSAAPALVHFDPVRVHPVRSIVTFASAFVPAYSPLPLSPVQTIWL